MGEEAPLSKKCIFFQQLSAQKLYYSDIGKVSKFTTLHRHYSFPPNPLKLEKVFAPEVFAKVFFFQKVFKKSIRTVEILKKVFARFYSPFLKSIQNWVFAWTIL